MRRSPPILLALAACLASVAATAQMGGPMSGRPTGGGAPPGEGIESTPAVEKPDVAARKAYNAGLKSVNKARDYEATAQKASTPEKKAAALEKENDALNRALDQFTEALTHKSDLEEAWNYACYVHLQLRAFGEAVDDCNHDLDLKPDSASAILYRAQAFLALDRLSEAKAAYMDLFNHERNLADQLMAAMQQWIAGHRQDPAGVRPADVDGFDHWVRERDGIAKQTASITDAAAPPGASSP